ncbi:HAD hydrolase-like protein [Amylibacter sp.]|jgi:HAD superfamily hydrolase (TIGR01450 family)|nr:HAD hydrolase-like protein [Amylibacter sp.]MDB9856910.1 HAD hydrolase-like protein [Amylibacter sp.]
MRTTPSILDQYEQVCARMPHAVTPTKFHDISSLVEIADHASAFVFDAFGVLNVVETLIEGADTRLNELRALGCKIRILTNDASYDRAGAVEKFQRLGLSINEGEIVTSRDANLACLGQGTWGIITASEDQLLDIEEDWIPLGDECKAYDDVDGFLFLSSKEWSDHRQNLLTKTLQKRPRPVLIGNADLVAPRGNGFSLELGYFGHLLVDAGIPNVRFFGKPFPEVYDLVECSLPKVRLNRIVMCGDTLHTDIMGAAARDWRTVLVTHDGLFSGHDTRKFCEKAGLFPDCRLSRI